MEQTALRPKPMPGSEPVGSTGPGGQGQGRRPHAARRRGRRLTSLLCGLFAGTVLVLSGVGLGTVGATVIGMSRLAELQRQAGPGGPGAPVGASAPVRPSPSGPAEPSPRVPDAALGLEAVDAERTGAEIVAVHIPGPGYTAGLVRGDVLLRFGGTEIDSATDLARAVDEARPGKQIKVTVRHRGGGFGRVTVIPGVVT
ncbi:PDZ domain-containing protein [Streptomyces sp. NBC_00637]|uniref:PDZ domain-containing protein n=1 Tax=Streptomyces sp. NBC_00637 TaxID=2903667 RepID=UPI0032500281